MVSAAVRRLAVVTGAPAPYREPLFDRLAADPSLCVRVFYCADGHNDVGWTGGAAEPSDVRVFLKNWTPRPLRRLPAAGYINPGIWNGLEQFDPDYVVVYGYNQATHWLAYAWCLRRKVPFAIRGDSNAAIDDAAGWRSRIRRRLVTRLIARAHAVLPIGSANCEYWRRAGARGSQIFSAPYAVDFERFAASGRFRAPEPGGRTRFLFAGRLIPRKRVDLLIQAFNAVVPTGRATLTVVGDGPERRRLQAMQSPAAWAATRWIGKASNEQMQRWYARCDVLVLPGWREPWGLVVQEAAAAGLAILADPRVGAVRDLLSSEHSAGAEIGRAHV